MYLNTLGPRPNAQCFAYVILECPFHKISFKFWLSIPNNNKKHSESPQLREFAECETVYWGMKQSSQLFLSVTLLTNTDPENRNNKSCVHNFWSMLDIQIKLYEAIELLKNHMYIYYIYICYTYMWLAWECVSAQFMQLSDFSSCHIQSILNVLWKSSHPFSVMWLTNTQPHPVWGAWNNLVKRETV